MAKKSGSTKRSLKSLFSKSEANLKESADGESGGGGKAKSFKLFKWKKKKKAETEPGAGNPDEVNTVRQNELDGSATAQEEDGMDLPVVGDDKKVTIYGTAPRSKKETLSYSESDLRKPRRFGTFSFGWKKKKKKKQHPADLSQSVVELEMPQEDLEEEEEEEEEPMTTCVISSAEDLSSKQVRFELSKSAPPGSLDTVSPPPGPTDQSQPQKVQTDSLALQEGGKAPDVVPVTPGSPAQSTEVILLQVNREESQEGMQFQVWSSPHADEHSLSNGDVQPSAVCAALSRALSMSKLGLPKQQEDDHFVTIPKVAGLSDPEKTELSNAVTPNTYTALINSNVHDTVIPTDTDLSLPKTDISDNVPQSSGPSDPSVSNADTCLPNTDITNSIIPDTDSSLPKTNMSDHVASNIDSSGPVMTNTDLSPPSTETSFPETELSDTVITADNVSPTSVTELSDTVSPSTDTYPINADISDISPKTDSSGPVIVNTGTPLPSTEPSDTAIATDDVSPPSECEPSDTVTPSTETTLINTDSFLPKPELSDATITADDVLPSSSGELLDASVPITDTTPINDDISDSVIPNTDQSLPDAELSDTVIPNTEISLSKTDITDIVAPHIDSPDAVITNIETSLSNKELSDTAIATDDVSPPSECELSDTVTPSTETTLINTDSSLPKPELSDIPNTDQSLPDTELSDTVIPNTDLSLSYTDISDAAIPNTDSTSLKTDTTDIVSPNIDSSDPVISNEPSDTVIATDDVSPPSECELSDTVTPSTDTTLINTDPSFPKSELSDAASTTDILPSSEGELSDTGAPSTGTVLINNDVSDSVIPNTDQSLPDTELSDTVIATDDVSPPTESELSDTVTPKTETTLIDTDTCLSKIELSDAATTSDGVSPPSESEIADTGDASTDSALINNDTSDFVVSNTDQSLPDAELSDTLIPNTESSSDPVITDTDTILPSNELSDPAITIDDVSSPIESEPSDTVIPSTETTLLNTDSSLPKSEQSDIPSAADDALPSSEGELSDTGAPSTDTALINNEMSDSVIPNADQSLPNTDISDTVIPSTDSPLLETDITDIVAPSIDSSDPAITNTDASVPSNELSDTGIAMDDDTTDQSLPDTEISDTAVPDTEISPPKTDISDVVAQNSDPSDTDDTNADTCIPDTEISNFIMPDDDSSLPTTTMSDVVAPNIDVSPPSKTVLSDPVSPSSDTSPVNMDISDAVITNTDHSLPNTELPVTADTNTDASLSNVKLSDTDIANDAATNTDPSDTVITNTDLSLPNTDLSDTIIATDNVSPSPNTDVIDSDAPNTDISNTEAREPLPEGDLKTGRSSPDISVSDGYNPLHLTADGADEPDDPDSIIPAVAVSGTMSQRQESLTEEEGEEGEGTVTESDRQDGGGEEPQCDEEILQESPEEDEAASSPRGHDVMDVSASLQQECENEGEMEEERGEELEQWRDRNDREEEREAEWGEHQQGQEEEERLQLEEGQDVEEDRQEMQVDDLEVLRQKEEVEEEREEVQQRPQIPAAELDSPVCQERGPQECEPAPPSPEPEEEGPQQTWSMATQTLHSVPSSGEETTGKVKHWADDTNNNTVLADRLTEEAHTVTNSSERAEAHTDSSDSTDTLTDSAERADAFIDAVTERAEPAHAPTLSDVLTETEESQSSLHPLTPADSFAYDLSVPSAAVEEPLPAVQVDLDAMNSGFGVLSTTLNVRPLLAQEMKEDGRPRFHKVSLVSTRDDSSEDCGPGPGAVQNDGKTHLDVKENQQSVQFQDGRSVPEESVSWKSPWSNSEPGVSSYSHGSPFPLDTQHLSSLGTHQKAGPSALSPEAPRSHGNAHWLSERSEVQPSWEREPGGRGWVEPAAPAEGRESEQEINTGSEAQRLSDSRLSPTQTEVPFSGVFKATRVELLPSPTSPDPGSPYDMDSLVDTLKSMDRPQRPRGVRPAPLTAFNSLPPIDENAPAPAPKAEEKTVSSPQAVLNGKPTLPPDLGLNWSSQKDLRSPLEMMKRQQEQDGLGPRSISLPQRASADSSIVFRKASPEGSPSPHLNGGGHQSPSRLDNSLLFSSYRTPERPAENGKAPAHHPLLRATSLPETGPTHERISSAPQGGTDAQNKTSTRFDRFSFLLSPTSSITEGVDSARISRPPSLTQNSLGEISFSSITAQPLDLHRSPPLDSPSRISLPPGALVLQRSLSGDPPLGSPVLNDTQRVPNFTPNPEPERVQVPKYRAFPDAYLTKEKEHGKLNPRPGKMFIYDQPGMCGERIEVRSDVIDATAWQLPETISIRVVRGGWVLYEKPNYKGEKIALDEGDIELTYPFRPPEEEQQQDGGQEVEPRPERQFVIGSLRRAVRDYSVPEISLFPEENAEGKKVIFRDTSEDARIYGFPIKASSIIINAGLWLVYAHPFFEGIPRVLEVGGYPNPAAWGVTQPYVGSLHPLKIGEPRVEKPNEPRMVIYEKPYFTGKTREIYNHTRDFMTRVDRKQNAFMYSAGSIKVLGGCWVGYSKENFRGNQYLLEEGEYHDWRVWGGCDSELRSVRLIRADFTEPMMVMFAMPEVENEEAEEEQTFEVTEAIPDVEPYGFRTMTRSIHVLSGAWIAYSHVDFSGNQYILEKGFYNNCGDWGAEDNRICSVQPILLAVGEDPVVRNKILLYSEPDFQGNCQLCDQNQESLPEKFHTKSCRVLGGSWAVYEGERFSGNPYILTEGDYPDFSSMGCLPDRSLRSLKIIPLMFAVPSISLFGLECFEGREITVDSEIPNLLNEGLNNHVLSVRVNSGCWVVCEHTNYRGRQVLLEPIEITNWVKFSELPTIGSMYPIRQKRLFFRIKNRERGHYLSIQGGVEEMKSGRVVVTEEVEGMSDIWFYQDGFIKNKLSPTMSLQVMGEVELGAKVVLWAETRKPIQTWTAHMSGTIVSLTFPGMVLDIKGGKTYDRNHVVIWRESEERPCQQWEIELL
ncbi:hypothetical protein MATL_G00233000 [Megalops atlanticus]|uniref:Beta/gamma crystallin 'Greek key' domain-containing protein n=1 Tax=Megalops atlanticus TaxID=7932 RepID=A0A9D3PIE4_MEGAT|nr:hypothetical protein MATL_G00233000 [Megalops atlanticus]